MTSPEDFSFPEDYDPAGFALEPGQMIIWEDSLYALQERLAHLIERAKYYHETPPDKATWLDILEDLTKRAETLRRTGKIL